MTNVRDALLKFAGRFHFGVEFRIRDFKFDDVNARAGLFQFIIHRMAQRAEANADAQIGFAAQGLNQRQNDFANGDGIFARLDIHIRDAGGAMMNEQFGKLVVIGAKTIERAIAAAHPAVGAIFAAIIGNLHDSAHKNLVAEARSGRERSFFMKCLLSLAVQIQHIGAGHTRLSHRRKIELTGLECK